eukprot:c39876_g1_i1.p1 GENE.c39876_g1_i1~~c39876_g1_i1.p1  ORF type:complete len:506 (-),score=82.52 c39876_g1_i1:82-1599(-)
MARLLLAAVLALLANAVVATSPKHNTMGATWLLTPHARTFCGTVPQIPTMELIMPSQQVPPCDLNAYHASLAPVWAVPLIIVALAFGALLVFGARVLCSQRPSGFGASDNVYVSVHATFVERPSEYRSVVVLLAGCLVLGALMTSVVGSFEVHSMFDNVVQIFREGYQNVQEAVETAATQIDELNVGSAADELVESARIGSSVFRDNSVFYISYLQTTDGLRTALLLAFILAAVIVIIGGALAVHLRARSSVRALLAFGLITYIGLWVNFTVYALSANILSDICVTVDACRFCTGADCPACNVPWYRAMSQCAETQGHRFKDLRDFVNLQISSAAAQYCTAMGTLCALPGLTCYQPHHCTASSLEKSGSTTIICLANRTEASNCTDLSGLSGEGALSPAVANQTAWVMADFQTLAAWQAVHASLSGLDCNKGGAFVNAVPLGTYNLLQQTVCPRPNWRLANPPQTAIARCAIGMLLAALVFPGILAALWAAQRRGVRTLTTASLT